MHQLPQRLADPSRRRWPSRRGEEAVDLDGLAAREAGGCWCGAMEEPICWKRRPLAEFAVRIRLFVMVSEPVMRCIAVVSPREVG